MRALARRRAPLHAALLTAALALGGCGALNGMLGGSSATDASAQVKWRFAPRAIEVRWQADNALNSADGKPHALLIAVLQMADAEPFHTAVVTPARLAQLLAAPATPTGFLSIERVFVQPGQTASVSLARVDRARFVGIVAGYYGVGDGFDRRLADKASVPASDQTGGTGEAPSGGGAPDPARIARLYEIGVAVKSRGLLIKNRSASVEPLVVDLRLGSGGIVSAAQSAAALAGSAAPLTLAP